VNDISTAIRAYNNEYNRLMTSDVHEHLHHENDSRKCCGDHERDAGATRSMEIR
jgi:hypothetical protein